MDILKPLEDEFKEKQQKEFRKRVTTTRVVVYVLIGFGLVSSITAMPNNEPGIPYSRWIIEVMPELMSIALMLYSYRKPFACLLIATVLFMFASIYTSIAFFRIEHETAEIVGNLTGQLLVMGVMIRGTINARKLTLNTQQTEMNNNEKHSRNI